jgi:hypothetical protein
MERMEIEFEFIYLFTFRKFHEFITLALDAGDCQVYILDALLPAKELQKATK